MKFTCKTTKLKEAISKVERIVSKQTTLPILGNILISSENGRLVLSATNLEIGIKTYIGAKIEEEGKITIPPRIISGFLGSIKDEVVSGITSENNLEINSSEHKIKIKGMDSKDFPLIPDMPEHIFFNIKATDVVRAAASVLVSVAHNDTRQELNGVYVKFEKNKVVMASTDSFRLCEICVDLIGDSVTDEYLSFMNQTPSIIIPSLTLSELQKVAGDENLSFSIDQNQLFIQNSDIKIISRLISGNYPEYKQVLPEKYEIKVGIQKDELINTIKIASLVANSTNGEVYIKNSDNNKALLITAQSMDTGDNLSKIPADISGPAFEIIFNCRYLQEGLGISALDNNKILLKLNQQKSPVMVKGLSENGNENEKFSYVIMPIVKG